MRLFILSIFKLPKTALPIG